MFQIQQDQMAGLRSSSPCLRPWPVAPLVSAPVASLGAQGSWDPSLPHLSSSELQPALSLLCLHSFSAEVSQKMVLGPGGGEVVSSASLQLVVLGGVMVFSGCLLLSGTSLGDVLPLR